MHIFLQALWCLMASSEINDNKKLIMQFSLDSQLSMIWNDWEIIVLQLSVIQLIMYNIFYYVFWKMLSKLSKPYLRTIISKEYTKNSTSSVFICVYSQLGFPVYLFGHFSQLNQSFIILPDCRQLVYLHIDIIHFFFMITQP